MASHPWSARAPQVILMFELSPTVLTPHSDPSSLGSAYLTSLLGIPSLSYWLFQSPGHEPCPCRNGGIDEVPQKGSWSTQDLASHPFLLTAHLFCLFSFGMLCLLFFSSNTSIPSLQLISSQVRPMADPSGLNQGPPPDKCSCSP